MTEKLKFATVDSKHMYFWLLRRYLQKATIHTTTVTFRIWNQRSETITLVKGPFAHKKSKEQFQIGCINIQFNNSRSLVLGLFLNRQNILLKSSGKTSRAFEALLERKIIINFINKKSSLICSPKLLKI